MIRLERCTLVVQAAALPREIGHFPLGRFTPSESEAAKSLERLKS